MRINQNTNGGTLMKLEGRTCVFAGATGMIGRGAVRAMCEMGMNVVMVTHNPDSAASIIASLEGLPGKAVAVSNAKGDDAVFADIEAQFGSVDVIINKTGGFDAPVHTADLDPEELSKKLNHQITSVFKMIQCALPYLERSKAPRIILTASAGAQNGFAGENIADSISRGGVISMTYALARDLMDKGITVNCIAASGIVNDHPPRSEKNLDSEKLVGCIPMGRIGTSDEFGAAVAYLASEESGFVTGQVINLSGGLVIG